MLRISDLNKKFDSRVSLNKGKGYFYFVFDDGVLFETESVYVVRLNNLTEKQWSVIYTEFFERIVNR
jgi:hypothetical protein